jgi:hypothetical protein
MLDANLFKTVEAWRDMDRFCTLVLGPLSVGRCQVELGIAGGGPALNLSCRYRHLDARHHSSPWAE